MSQDISSKTFEEALKELEDIVKQFEGGKLALDEAVTAYEKGLLLKQHCLQKLQQAKIRIDKVNQETSATSQEEDAA